MPDQKEHAIRMLVTEICTAGSLEEAYVLYKIAQPLLGGWKFIFASEKGASPGTAVNRTFSAGAAVRSLFATERIFVLDELTVDEMNSGKAVFPVDFSISLDTQALSYIEPFLRGSASKLPADFHEVFLFLARNDVQFDGVPYALENTSNLDDPYAANRIYEKLRAFEILRTLDQKWLQSRGEVRSTLTAAEIERGAQRKIAYMIENSRDVESLRHSRIKHWFIYSQLLKMVEIQFRSPNTPIAQKIFQFLDFCNSELATLSTRMIVIARMYFENGQRLSFFSKIQKKKPDLFRILDGMVWDLSHLFSMERVLALRPEPEARYYISALLTFDKRLTEIMDSYPLKACAYSEDASEILPFFDGNIENLISESDHTGAGLAERFFSEEAAYSRNLRKPKARNRMGEIAESLTQKVQEQAQIRSEDVNRNL